MGQQEGTIGVALFHLHDHRGGKAAVDRQQRFFVETLDNEGLGRFGQDQQFLWCRLGTVGTKEAHAQRDDLRRLAGLARRVG